MTSVDSDELCNLLLSLETPNDARSVASEYRLFKRLAKALIRLRVVTQIAKLCAFIHDNILAFRRQETRFQSSESVTGFIQLVAKKL